MPCTPIPNDKDSGYTLVSDSDMSSVLFDITCSDRYEKIPEGTLRLDELEAVKKIRFLAKKISKCEGRLGLDVGYLRCL